MKSQRATRVLVCLLVLGTSFLLGSLWASTTTRSVPPDITGAESVQGQLKAINLVTSQIVVENPDGITTVIHTTKTTQIKRGENQIELRDLMVGEQAMVQFQLVKDKRMAQSIQVEPK